MKNGALFKYSKIVSTVGAITSFKAVKADTFVAEFDAAVPDTATVDIKKSDVVQDGEYKWSEDRKSVTFTAKVNFSTGEYVITVKNGDGTPATATASVEDEKVSEIKLLTSKTSGKRALTNPRTDTNVANTEAYIYYGVYNQYGDDMTASTDITWTISSCERYDVDPSAGKITIYAADGKPFTYNDTIYVVGVYSNSGVSATVNDSVEIGMEQSTDKVEIAGFVNDKTNKGKIEESLPTNFAADTWYMVYKTYDQNEMPLDAVKYDDSDDITFISDNPLLLSIPTTKAGGNIYNIGGTKYASVKVQPGQYSDKGGEVNITAMSKKTGHKEVKNYVVGADVILQSLTLGNPSGVIADGDQNVDIPFTAKDTKGNTVTNYEKIVRSSNALSLSASEGVLVVYEKNDGTAGIKWSDSLGATEFDKSTASDNTARPVSLTTIVVGGESNNKLINVKDMRRPVAFSSVKFGPDANDALVIGNTANVELLADKDFDHRNEANVIYIDQYGQELVPNVSRAFFDQAMTSGFNKEKYALRVKTDDNTELALTGSDENGYSNYKDVSASAKFAAKDNTESSLEKNKTIDTVTVTYSIATVSENGDSEKYTDKGKKLTATYSVVPQSAVKGNASITTNASRYYAETANSGYANGLNITAENGLNASMADFVSTGSAIDLAAGNMGYSVKGTTKSGLTCTLPASMYEVAEDSEIQATKGEIESVSGSAIRWFELYDDNTARVTRIDAKKTLTIGIGDAKISKTLVLSDAAPVATKFDWFSVNGTPKETALQLYGFGKVLDQYDNEVSKDQVNVTYSVSSIEEADTEFTHLANSFDVANNGTEKLKVSGIEIGDKFTVTATVTQKNNRNIGFSANASVVAGADAAAYIADKDAAGIDADSDATWRKKAIADGGLGMSK